MRLVWNTPAVPGGRWHGGLLNLKRVPRGRRRRQLATARPDDPIWREYRRHRPHLSVRGLLAWCLIGGLLTYLGGAAVLRQRLQNAQPHLQLSYLDLALPSRWSNLERLRGEALAVQGRELIAANRFSEGFSMLRAALARHPSDHSTRLTVARIYSSLRLRPQALKLLREGLVFGYPGRDSLDFAVQLLTEAEDHDATLEFCQLAREKLAALPAQSRPRGDAAWLDRQTVQTLFALGRRQDGVALAHACFPAADPFLREILILDHLAAGRIPEAASLARDWVSAEPKNSSALRLLIRIDREVGDFSALDADLLRLRDLSPAQPASLLVAISENHRAGRTDQVRDSLDALTLRHGSDPALYHLLAPLLATLPFPEGLDRIENELRERGLPLLPVQSARLQLAVGHRDWPAVLHHATSILASPAPGITPEQSAWHQTAAHLARACLDGSTGTQTSLIELVAARPGKLRLYALLIDSLLSAGRPATARQILTFAEGPYPDSPAIAALRSRIESALSAATQQPVAPAPASTNFASLAALDAAFSSCLEKQDPAAALELLASARRARPDWLSAAALHLDTLELPLRARGEDSLRLQLLVRSTFPRATSAEALLDLARTIHREGHRENALLLLHEILRHFPDHADTLTQLSAWQPPATSAAFPSP